MIDIKKHITKQFSKACSTYEDEAVIQKMMADKLIAFLDSKEYQSVLEIGCGTGYLTSLIINNLNYKKLCINDMSANMVDFCKQRFSSSVNEYIVADAENLNLDNKFSLIISNACFQWFSDLKNALLNLKTHLTADGVIVFSTFLDGNFAEIKDTLGISIDYLQKDKIECILKELNLSYSIEDMEVKSHFSNVRSMLKSFKKTGVSGLSNSTWTKSRLLSFEENYKNKFSDEFGVYLTWKLCFIKAKSNL